MNFARGDRVSEHRDLRLCGEQPRVVTGVVTRVTTSVHTELAKVLWDDTTIRGFDSEGLWRPVARLNYLGASTEPLPGLEPPQERVEAPRGFSVKGE
jgi:hypothetical protein